MKKLVISIMLMALLSTTVLAGSSVGIVTSFKEEQKHWGVVERGNQYSNVVVGFQPYKSGELGEPLKGVALNVSVTVSDDNVEPQDFIFEGLTQTTYKYNFTLDVPNDIEAGNYTVSICGHTASGACHKAKYEILEDYKKPCDRTCNMIIKSLERVKQSIERLIVRRDKYITMLEGYDI